MRLNPESANEDEEDQLPELRDIQDENERKMALDKFRSEKLDVFNVKVKSANRQVGTIFTEMKPSLMLLEHWTLFDSLMNTNFIIAHFNLWNEEGRSRL